MNTLSKNTKTIAAKTGIIISLIVLALTSWGCEDSKVVGTDQNKDNQNQSDTGAGETDDSGHGPDKDAETFAIGVMTGSWRVSNDKDDSMIANFDLFQEEQNPALEGYYTMSMIAGNGADSESGDIMDTSTFDGETLTLNWNPTPTADELYTVSATRQDDGTFKGTLSAAIYTELETEVRVTPLTPPPSNGSDAGETAGDIDAGSQGGAGGF